MLVTKELIVSAKTIDAAIAQGLEQLGLDRDAISVEVLSTPSRGFLFGIGATDAKVRLTYEVEEKNPPKPQPQPQKPPQAARPEQPAAQKPQPPAPPAREQAPQEPRQQKPQPPQRQEQPRQQRPEQPKPQRPEQPRQEQPRQEQPRQEQPRQQPERPVPQPEPELPMTPVTDSGAIRFLKEVLQLMQLEGSVTAETDGVSLKISLEGENLGLLIGRRGETLDALQYLTGLTVMHKEEYAKVSLDIQQYRAKREKTLVQLAHKTAAKVLQDRRPVTLESMSAYERRIIHATLQGTEGIQTASVGHEPTRRVQISPAGAAATEGTPQQPQGGGQSGGAHSGNRRRRRGGRKPAQQKPEQSGE